MSSHVAWSGTIGQFLVEDASQLTAELKSHHQRCMTCPADPSQVIAWNNCLSAIKSQFSSLIHSAPHAANWVVAFEYELPRERGRRPDVVVIANTAIFVLEFKDFSTPRNSHLDQVSAYARDLQHYHAASHGLLIRPILVLTKSSSLWEQHDEVLTISADNIARLLQTEGGPAAQTIVDSATWLNADYAPLPSLVSAARTIFNHEPLPQIRRAQSAGIPEALAALNAIAKAAKNKGERHLALITGVPGAGKTLVGLQFVYENEFDQAGGAQRTAIFLTGNGPLSKVLQHALRNSIFVRDVHGFLKQYGGNQDSTPSEHIWVYDEAQRAWDSDRVSEKRGHATSEPEDFLKIGERMDTWSLMVGLIGDGQEIHLGEESGLKQWNDAIAAMALPWTVHCPSRVASLFTKAAVLDTNDKLDLNTSLRSHIAEDVQVWVRSLLDGNIDRASSVCQRMRQQGFDVYVTRSIESAFDYVRQRYAGQEDKRFGLLASSKAKNLPEFGIRNDYGFTKNFREGPWYNDAPSSPQSCCQLKEVATEFQCQGLELDFPVIAWGNDLKWNLSKWQPVAQPRSHAKNPAQLRLNSYRVLLSRGRDGFIVFVPSASEMDSTYAALQAAGLVILK